MIYTVSIASKTIKIVGDSELVRGNVEIDYLDATFDAEWADMERIYCVFYDGKPEGTRMKMEDGRCEIPWERLEDTDTIKLTFIGYDDDDEDNDRRIVTREMVNSFTVKEHGWMDGDDPAEPTPTAWNVMEQRLEELEANGGGGAALPEGGTEGQVLTLDAEGNAAWGDVDIPTDYVSINDFREAHETINEALDACLTELPEHTHSWEALEDKPTIPTVPTKVSAFENDKGYLTEVPSEYVTDSELTEKGYQTAEQVAAIVNNALGVIENGSY